VTTSLVDTNILIYSFDRRYPVKQRVARELLDEGACHGSLVLAHQTIVEFVAAASRPRADLGGQSILRPEQARFEAEEFMIQFQIVYPDEAVLRTALRGVSAYGLSWFDAHLWAYAEVNGLGEIYTEDFEHGRYYGSVRAVDPFLVAADAVHELPAMYAS
jgi:predicted nucleic acid-binding protein